MEQFKVISSDGAKDDGIKPGQVCPMPAKGAMGSAIVTLIL